MSKTSLALKLADELGTSVSKAKTLIDDVGTTRARAVLDDAASGGSRLPDDWWKGAVAVGGGTGAIGGGALLWRQQDVERAKALARNSESKSDAYKNIIESDLSKEARRKLLRQALENGGTPPGGNNPDGDKDDGGLIPGDAQTTIVLLIVAAFAFKYTLGDND